MNNRFVEQCKKAKAAGYKYVASVVKNHYATTYYHVNDIDRLIDRGRWIPAPKNTIGWCGRVGQSQVPEHTLLKVRLYTL